MALEWQELPKIPIGRADDIAIGYTPPPQEDQRIYVADQYSWPYRSNDGGITWDSLGYAPPQAYNPIAIVCDPNNAKNVWIARSWPNENPGVFYSSDEGNTWTPRNDSITNFKILTLKMAPDNPNFLFLGCRYDPNTSSNIFKTENGGITWHALTPLIDADIYDIETPSSNSGIILVATDKGIYKSINGGINWYQTYSYATRDLKINPLNSNEVYACVPSNHCVIKSNDQGETWNVVLNLGDIGMPMGVDVSFSGKIYVAIENEKIESNVMGYKSSDGGISWQVFTSYNGIFDRMGRVIRSDPRNPTIIFLGCENTIYKTENEGENWIQTDKGFRRAFPNDASVCLPYGIYFYSALKNTVYKSSDFGLNWKLIFSIGEAMIRPLWKYLFVHPLIPGKIFLTGEGGINGGMMIFTQDDGLNWSMPNFPHFAATNGQMITHTPSYPNYLFMACHTPEQFMVSENNGDDWWGVNIEINGITPI